MECYYLSNNDTKERKKSLQSRGSKGNFFPDFFLIPFFYFIFPSFFSGMKRDRDGMV